MDKLIVCFLMVAVTAATAFSAESEDPYRMARLLYRSTVRIETDKGDKGSQGTGFFFTFPNPSGNRFPVVVTCRHVVEGANVAQLFFALASTNSQVRGESHFPATVKNFRDAWVPHPDTNIDLAIIPIAPIMKAYKQRGRELDFVSIPESLIATNFNEVGVFRDLKVVGYPEGVWDVKHNLPVARRGMAATEPAIDHNGRPEFLIDAPIFPGSSGSPVLIVDVGIGYEGSSLTRGTRIRLLGVLYAVHRYSAEGDVKIVTIPAAFDAKSETRIPMDLGLVIKADQLMDFKPILLAKQRAFDAGSAVPEKPTETGK